MPRYRKRGLHLPIISLGPFDMTEGDLKFLEKGKDEDYVTTVGFVLPLDEKEFVQGNYQASYKDSVINVNLFQIMNETKDPIYALGKRMQFGASMQLQNLPFSIFTDNRSKYPCFFAEIKFPFRLKDWKSKTKEEINEASFTGVFSKDKSLALKILNGLFLDDKYPEEVRPLRYEDVTNFLELYFQKGHPQKPICHYLAILDSRNAFEESIIDYLGDDLWQHVFGLAETKEKKEIENEADLYARVIEIVNGEIKHHIENRYWIEPYWDDTRRFDLEGANITIPKQPKSESSIQSTLYWLLYISLIPFGIHVEKETDEGVGLLDFKCLYTTKDGVPLKVLIEFKLAHHGNITHGLNHQLPAYLKANKCNHGVFLVMWFKDEKGKIFNKPKKQKKQEMLTRLRQIASFVQKENNFIIGVEMIDASVKPSASKL